MNLTTIRNDVQKGKFAPIYLLYGDEPFFINKAVSIIDEYVLSEAERGFNQAVFYGADIEGQKLNEVCARLPMMATRSYVLVKEAQDIPTEYLTHLLDYMLKPNPKTVLVLAWKRKIDKRREFYTKGVKKNEHLCILESKAIPDYKLEEWLGHYAQSVGFRLDSKSVSLMAEFLGNDLSTIYQAFEKLKLVMPDNAHINADIIEQYIGISKEYNKFELKDALGNRNPERVMRILSYYRGNSKAFYLPLILATIYNQMVVLYQLKMISSPTVQDVKVIGNIHAFPVQQSILRQVANYTLPELSRVLMLLSSYESKAKGIGVRNSPTKSIELLTEFCMIVVNPSLLAASKNLSVARTA